VTDAEARAYRALWGPYHKFKAEERARYEARRAAELNDWARQADTRNDLVGVDDRLAERAFVRRGLLCPSPPPAPPFVPVGLLEKAAFWAGRMYARITMWFSRSRRAA
jgi:hypothetical protein